MRIRARVLTFVFMLTAVAGSAEAQQRPWGLKGGINFATLTSDADTDPKPGYLFGLIGGGFFIWPLTPRISFQPEVLYSQQGDALTDFGVDTKTKLDYLSFPLLVRYTLKTSGKPVFVFGGPSLNVKLRARASASIGDSTTEINISDEIETFDFGVVVGGGMEFGRYSVDGRYTWGFSNIDKEVTDVKTRNRVIGVLVGARF
jgi:hypothetical protein